MGVQIGIVIGGGNIFRGLSGSQKGFDRVKGDQMGMLATVINSLALQSALEDNGVRCKVLTSIRMEPIGEYFSKARAIEYLEAGYVVIIGGGTSNPYFTTDSASALRGIEIEADVLLKGTRVDGVYTADPEKDPTATKFGEITFEEVLERRLKVMDLTAFTLCRENGLQIIVFDMDTEGNLARSLPVNRSAPWSRPDGEAHKKDETTYGKKKEKQRATVGDAGADRHHHRRDLPAALVRQPQRKGQRIAERQHDAGQGRTTRPGLLRRPVRRSHLTLSELRGKVVLLNFWATCARPAARS